MWSHVGLNVGGKFTRPFEVVFDQSEAQKVARQDLVKREPDRGGAQKHPLDMILYSSFIMFYFSASKRLGP